MARAMANPSRRAKAVPVQKAAKQDQRQEQQRPWEEELDDNSVFGVETPVIELAIAQCHPVTRSARLEKKLKVP